MLRMTIAESVNSDARRRVGLAWRKMRRGASAVRIKDLFYGDGEESLDLALADALVVICHVGTMRMGELADALQITPASTTRAVTCLTEKGYVERIKATDDHRSILVSPTETGRARCEIINAKIQGGLNEILSEFTPDEQAQLADLMERYVRSLDRFVARHADAEN